jgi:hypothetical protein
MRVFLKNLPEGCTGYGNNILTPLSSVSRQGAKGSYDASWLVDYDEVAILVMEEKFHRGGGYGWFVPMYRVSTECFNAT